MDELKKYLQSQKDFLELEEPSEKVWTGINASVQTPVKSMQWRKWSVAASVIFLVGLGVWKMKKSSPAINPIVRSTNKEITPNIKEEKDSISNEANASVAINPFNKPLNYPAASPITTIHTVHELNSADQTKLFAMEESFHQVINMQKARISTTPLYAESPNYFSEFHQQLQQMEKDEVQIKTYIKKNGMSDELLDQLINVYQQKLNMLKQLQIEMQKLNSRFKQNRPAVDTLKTYFLNL
jgi:cytoskeletal protein RodZ